MKRRRIFLGATSLGLALAGFLTTKAMTHQTQVYIQTSPGSSQCQITSTVPAGCVTNAITPCTDVLGRRFFLSVNNPTDNQCQQQLSRN